MDTLEAARAGEERIIVGSRRPDGSLRKEIRIRAGYTPQDEVAIYQPKGAQFRKGTDFPPGYDPDASAKPKTKAAKKNEKRKEKKQQVVQSVLTPGEAPGEGKSHMDARQESVSRAEASSLAQHMGVLNILSSAPDTKQESQQEEGSATKAHLEKRLRALKKKIRLTESKEVTSGSSYSAEQADKLFKLETWRRELQGLEDQWASM